MNSLHARLLLIALPFVLSGCQTAPKFQPIKLPAEEVRDGIEADRVFFARLTGALKNDPANIDKVLSTEGTLEKSDLGFGYTLLEGEAGRHFGSLSYAKLYHLDKLVSYHLSLWVLDKPELKPIYFDMCREVFRISPDGSKAEYEYNAAAFSSLLSGCPVSPPPPDEQEKIFMSPLSGTVYGMRGGFAGAVLGNRRSYLAIVGKITPDTCLALLYSINPASRLTTYEHYLRHKSKYESVSSQIEQRMNEVFAEKPRITTMRGCIRQEEEARVRVSEVVKLPNPGSERISE